MATPAFDTRSPHAGRLPDLCPVVDGAIVSKPLIDTDGCKQILFAMDAGQEMSEHRAPFVATVHVLEGRIRFRLGADEHDLGRDDWLVMPPDAPHGLRAEAPSRFLLTLVKR